MTLKCHNTYKNNWKWNLKVLFNFPKKSSIAFPLTVLCVFGQSPSDSPLAKGEECARVRVMQIKYLRSEWKKSRTKRITRPGFGEEEMEWDLVFLIFSSPFFIYVSDGFAVLDDCQVMKKSTEPGQQTSWTRQGQRIKLNGFCFCAKWSIQSKIFFLVLIMKIPTGFISN